MALAKALELMQDLPEQMMLSLAETSYFIGMRVVEADRESKINEAVSFFVIATNALDQIFSHSVSRLKDGQAGIRDEAAELQKKTYMAMAFAHIEAK
jgi:hypothetical protein